MTKNVSPGDPIRTKLKAARTRRLELVKTIYLKVLNAAKRGKLASTAGLDEKVRRLTDEVHLLEGELRKVERVVENPESSMLPSGYNRHRYGCRASGAPPKT